MAKLGQLLVERSSIKKRKMSLVEQLKAVVWAPEEQKDEYMATGAKLMQKFIELSQEEVELTKKISEINSSVMVQGTNMTLSQSIALLGSIQDTLSLYDVMLDRIQALPLGDEKSQTSWVNILSVDTLSMMKEAKIKEMEALDAAIQTTNWDTEVSTPVASNSQFQNSSQLKSQNSSQSTPPARLPQQMSNNLTEAQAKMVDLYQQLDQSGDKGYHIPHTNAVRSQDVMPGASFEEPQPKMQKQAESLDTSVQRFLSMPKIKDPACPVCNLDDILRAKVDALYDRTGEIMRVHEFLEKERVNITGPQLRRYLDEFHPTRGVPAEQSGPFVPRV